MAPPELSPESRIASNRRDLPPCILAFAHDLARKGCQRCGIMRVACSNRLVESLQHAGERVIRNHRRLRQPSFPSWRRRLLRRSDLVWAEIRMSARTCLTIVLAAGEGTRMRASRPKVLHAIGGRSLIAHVLAAADAAGGARGVVVGPAQGADQQAVVAAVKAAMPGAELFVQSERRGTAHAVLAAKPA